MKVVKIYNMQRHYVDKQTSFVVLFIIYEIYIHVFVLMY